MTVTLYDRQHWPEVQVWASYTETPLPDDLVQSVHLIALDPDGHIAVCRDIHGAVFLPGGTREPDESIDACCRREIREEAGLELMGTPVWFGAHLADGYKATPYRPHLPHPRKAWLWGVADAAISGPPTNPDGAEQVTEVLMLPLPQAKVLLSRTKPWYGELLDRAIHFYERNRSDGSRPRS
ncbi:NUDIX hydrolase [Streptomyces sp. NPDC004752]